MWDTLILTSREVYSTRREQLQPKSYVVFEEVQIRDKPEKVMMIRVDLIPNLQKDFVSCLKDNVDLFTYTTDEMLGIDLEVACHKLSIDMKYRCVAQHCHKQSAENIEATKKMVDDFIKANFVI